MGYWTVDKEEQCQEALDYLEKLIKEIDSQYIKEKNRSMIRHLERRLKTEQSIAAKLARKEVDPDKVIIEDVIKDLAGLRLICFDVDQIYFAADQLSKNPSVSIERVKDYVKKPKKSGYQSYHMTMIINGCKVELQIRTILMDAWASLDAILSYKSRDSIPADLQKQISDYAKWSRKMGKAVHRMIKKGKLE